MKVIFIEDVPNVAHAGETKVVADGYGRNYLLPRRLAVLADSRASALVKAQLKKRERLVAQTEAEMRELAGKLAGLEITLKAKAGAKERLYGSITSADVAEALSQKVGSLVDKRKVELAQSIHQLGSYDVTVRFTHEISAVIKLTVTGEAEAGATEKKEEKKAEAKAEEVKPAAGPEKAAEKKEKKPKAEKKAKPAEAKEEAKAEKAKKPKKAEDSGAKAEKKEKKSKAEKPEATVEAKPEAKVEKKGKVKKKVEEAGEKDAEPGK